MKYMYKNLLTREEVIFLSERGLDFGNHAFVSIALHGGNLIVDQGQNVQEMVSGNQHQIND